MKKLKIDGIEYKIKDDVADLIEMISRERDDLKELINNNTIIDRLLDKIILGAEILSKNSDIAVKTVASAITEEIEKFRKMVSQSDI